MVKKRMAMRMVTIFVALIVCGMFFPVLARGLSVNTELFVPLGDVEVGEEKITSVEIKNEGGSPVSIWPALDEEATCPEEYFEYTGPDTGSNIYQMDAGGTVTVKVTFKPLTVCACRAWLKITPLTSGVAAVVIEFTANGVEKASERFEEIVIGDIQTGVLDRIDGDGDYIGDIISECQKSALNHGQWVGCVFRYLRELRMAEKISSEECRRLQRCTAQAAIKNMMHKIKKAKRSGRRNHRRITWRPHRWDR